ncbi:Flavoprotein [Sesbania bispinosa]|nr:Flavoprotein [Sesbania bispinosa]
MACSEPVSVEGETISMDAAPRKPRILLAASGSVAAVKFANLCHCFSEWAEVRAVATGDSVLHIELRRWADIMVIAPLSANTLGKPFFVAPAMNTFMWNNPFTERHLISIDESAFLSFHSTCYKEVSLWGLRQWCNG